MIAVLICSDTGLAPVHLATRESSIDVLKFLFQMGANKNAMVSPSLGLCVCVTVCGSEIFLFVLRVVGGVFCITWHDVCVIIRT